MTTIHLKKGVDPSVETSCVSNNIPQAVRSDQYNKSAIVINI